MIEATSGAQKPKLSILVPTFNRALFLSSLLTGLCEQVASLSKSLVEIVVANNASTDETSNIVKEFVDNFPFVREYQQPQHVFSAEENIFSALRECRGEFVWTVSDDDRISERSAETILRCIDTSAASFILLNVSLMNTSGRLRQYHYISPEVFLPIVSRENTLADIVASLGFLGLLTSISSAVFRRDDVLAIDWEEITQVSPIYAHAAVYYRAFHNKKAVFFPAPLVWVYDEEGVALEKIAFASARAGKQRLFSWTVGLSRLVKFLGLDVSEIIEIGPAPAAKLGDILLAITCDQIDIWLKTQRPEEALTDIDLREIAINIAGAKDLRYQHMWSKLVRLGPLIRVLARGSDADVAAVLSPMRFLPERTLNDFRTLAREKIAGVLGEIRSGLNVLPMREAVYERAGYRYRQARGLWVATRSSVPELDYGLEEPVAIPPDVLVASTRDELERRLTEMAASNWSFLS